MKKNSFLMHGIPTLAISIVLFYNLASVNLIPSLPPVVLDIARSTGLEQRWTLFAPHPPREDVWLIIPGTKADGTEVNLYTGDAVTFTKPPHDSSRFNNERWERLLLNVFRKNGYSAYAPSVGAYLCNEWNNTHIDQERVEKISIYGGLEHNPGPDGPYATTTPLFLWSGTCAP